MEIHSEIFEWLFCVWAGILFTCFTALMDTALGCSQSDLRIPFQKHNISIRSVQKPLDAIIKSSETS